MQINSIVRLSAAGALALVIAAPAFAQDTAAPAAEGAYVDKGDIIVTARKRQESILKVPVVESVITPEAISKAAITDVGGVTRNVPGLVIGGNVLTVGAQISLRGVGTSTLDAGVDQSVSLNIDGLQFSQGATYNVGLFDLAQVEVLKGPQALFFGKNSPGGVIAMRTNDPGPAAEVAFTQSYEAYSHEKRSELILSGPVTDTLGLRFAGMYSDDDGYFFNKATAQPGTGAVTPNSRFGRTEQYILRGTAVWRPTDAFSARLKVNHAYQRTDGAGSPLGSCPDGPGLPASAKVLNPNVQLINPNDNCKVDRDVYIVDLDPAAFADVRNGGRTFMKTLQSFGTLEMTYRTDSNMAITSTTGYFKTTVDGMINGVNSGHAGPTLFADNHFTRRDTTEELRIESDNSGSLNWLVGGYYQNARVRNRVVVNGNNRYNTDILAGLGIPVLPVPFIFATFKGINDVHIESISGFGQLRWKVVPELELTAGARYTHETRDDDTYSLTSMYATPVPITVPNPHLSSSNVSPEFTITYTPTDDLTIFAAAKRGYKSGSFILTSPPSAGTDNSFGDEKVTGGEVGFKARVLDRAVSVNGAFYYYKYEGLQVGANTIDPATGNTVIKTVNAASAKVYGVDFDMNYRPPSIDGLALRLSVNWNHGRFENFYGATCDSGQTISAGCNEVIGGSPGRDLSNTRLPRAADWMLNGGFDYDLAAGSNHTVSFGSNVQYSSKYTTTLGNDARTTQPAFAKWNANLSVKANSGAWEVALIGNNLTNKFTTGNCTLFDAAGGNVLAISAPGLAVSPIGQPEAACIADPGRQVYLRLTLRPTAF
ncbi:TonB-dependent receptor [Novosphingobium album (ex Liu et al. 2023)]|uniref:TonB-dependent receptor n=1 Tax=Novosphingobium album (ex Liu et al. 2023) TaxID=3031130 RepID=A0ABT5WTG9_9SPHN|nr:TonB-dependent receptor [Novosphingobium album (ex Liu et al. 2023)]MDE8653173.1 TonB-dependent receptor [Novosphingobium album (ex Liu et al. 2023)]